MQKVALEVVAGTIEDNGNPLETAKRELKEETGLTAKNWKFLGKIHMSANMSAVAHIFIARELTQGKPQLDDDEEISVVKMPFEEAVEKVISGEIDIASNIAAILLFDKLRKESKI